MACCCTNPTLVFAVDRSKGIEAEADALTRRIWNPSQRLTLKKNFFKLQAELEGNKRSSVSAVNAQIIRDELVGLISGEERGLRTQTNRQKRDEILKAIDALAALGTGMVTTDESLTAAWRVLWTTEKEQLFIVEKAHVFGTRAGDIFQVIDVASGTLTNFITFPPTGMFLVNSTIEVASAQRMNFKFTGASLRVGNWKIPLPPFGQGWFESLYLDEKIRVAKDSRGDYLVSDRAPSVSKPL